jgi:hypothetical protein
MVVGILACNLLCLLPNEASFALQRLEVEFDQLGAALVVYKAIRVNTEAIHMPVAPDDALSRHGPEQGVQSARLLAEEIPSGIVGGGSRWHLAVLLRLDRVNEIRESNGILNEEDGNVVSDNVKISLVSVETSGKPVDIASCVGRPAGSSDGGETDKCWRALSLCGQE